MDIGINQLFRFFQIFGWVFFAIVLFIRGEFYQISTILIIIIGHYVIGRVKKYYTDIKNN